MSSIPLISHHLFVAAAKTNGTRSTDRELVKALAPEVRSLLRELPFELIDFGRPLPIAESLGYNALPPSSSP